MKENFTSNLIDAFNHGIAAVIHVLVPTAIDYCPAQKRRSSFTPLQFGLIFELPRHVYFAICNHLIVHS